MAQSPCCYADHGEITTFACHGCCFTRSAWNPVDSARATIRITFFILGGAYGSIKANSLPCSPLSSIKPDDAAILGGQPVGSAVGTQPYFALVFCDTRHTVVGESLGCGIMFRLYTLSEVEAEGSILGAIPYVVFAINPNTQCEKRFLFRQLMPLKVETQLFRLRSSGSACFSSVTYC